MNNKTLHWWPLCFSETVPTNRPIALFWGSQELALYRDKNGIVRAVEDRCPHRRAPLSLGRVTSAGHIQCGYHGWTFDGESGDISGFPNLDDGERLPKCAIQTFPVCESNGVVYIACSQHENAPVGLGSNNSASELNSRFSGKTSFGLSHRECVAALLDDPQLFVDISGVEILEKAYGDPAFDNGAFITERAARWNLLGESRWYWGPLRHRADFPLILRTATIPSTGETKIALSREDGRVMCEMHVIFTTSTRDMTTVHWQSVVEYSEWGLLTPALALLRILKRAPIKLRHSIDADALARTLPNAGEQWRELSDSMPAELSAELINQEGVC